ncbi:unnamed protein product [Prorocentrum cordatum]|uniref:Microbial-type PARG catalytic domain-containing protein n=1 Tax=Prorocentrum cordatum TaxID=2364126 RepID=A0ABN9Q6F3_9DINO|nr:unnamed protein product [Polarella glacialis]
MRWRDAAGEPAGHGNEGVSSASDDSQDCLLHGAPRPSSRGRCCGCAQRRALLVAAAASAAVVALGAGIAGAPRGGTAASPPARAPALARAGAEVGRRQGSSCGHASGKGPCCVDSDRLLDSDRDYLVADDGVWRAGGSGHFDAEMGNCIRREENYSAPCARCFGELDKRQLRESMIAQLNSKFIQGLCKMPDSLTTECDDWAWKQRSDAGADHSGAKVVGQVDDNQYWQQDWGDGARCDDRGCWWNSEAEWGGEVGGASREEAARANAAKVGARHWQREAGASGGKVGRRAASAPTPRPVACPNGLADAVPDCVPDARGRGCAFAGARAYAINVLLCADRCAGAPVAALGDVAPRLRGVPPPFCQLWEPRCALPAVAQRAPFERGLEAAIWRPGNDLVPRAPSQCGPSTALFSNRKDRLHWVWECAPELPVRDESRFHALSGCKPAVVGERAGATRARNRGPDALCVREARETARAVRGVSAASASSGRKGPGPRAPTSRRLRLAWGGQVLSPPQSLIGFCADPVSAIAGRCCRGRPVAGQRLSNDAMSMAPPAPSTPLDVPESSEQKIDQSEYGIHGCFRHRGTRQFAVILCARVAANAGCEFWLGCQGAVAARESSAKSAADAPATGFNGTRIAASASKTPLGNGAASEPQPRGSSAGRAGGAAMAGAGAGRAPPLGTTPARSPAPSTRAAAAGARPLPADRAAEASPAGRSAPPLPPFRGCEVARAGAAATAAAPPRGPWTRDPPLTTPGAGRADSGPPAARGPVAARPTRGAEPTAPLAERPAARPRPSEAGGPPAAAAAGGAPRGPHGPPAAAAACGWRGDGRSPHGAAGAAVHGPSAAGGPRYGSHSPHEGHRGPAGPHPSPGPRAPREPWDAHGFIQRWSQALAGVDFGRESRVLLRSVAEHNYVIRDAFPAPRTELVSHLECASAWRQRAGTEASRTPRVSYCGSTTADAALRLAGGAGVRSRVCLLNFANGAQVGGGYKSGAQAQEEDLCRRVPGLYTTLYRAAHFDGLYPFGPATAASAAEPHKYSDVLWTPGLAIGRRGQQSGFALLGEEDQMEVSVVSAAAPNIRFASPPEISDRELIYNTGEP